MNESEGEGAEGTVCNVKDVPGAAATAHDGESEAETTDNIENELRDILGSSPKEPYQYSDSEYVPDHRSRSSSLNLQHILEDLSNEEDQSTNKVSILFPEYVKHATEDFYKDISRKSVENLLRTRQNGTFVIRPSQNSILGTISVVQDSKVFHLNIRRREDGFIALGKLIRVFISVMEGVGIMKKKRKIYSDESGKRECSKKRKSNGESYINRSQIEVMAKEFCIVSSCCLDSCCSNIDADCQLQLYDTFYSQSKSLQDAHLASCMSRHTKRKLVSMCGLM
ncbi:unnamed protein product [Diabrotica balteata]|uniref:SH2 domain-containing protein n=1 Tax=Diabrotica balteata TaxID=107213 RepID=A0A9N9X8J4_DIABA|nr:unnamed protein product [Diabrotica balteata]